MNYFFNPKDLNILKSFSVVNTLFAFDFDGTLAPIVSNPDDAALSNKTAELMKELNKLVPIAIITGRSLKDIKKLLPFQPKYLIGNHGMEGMQDAAELERIKGNCRNWLKLLTEFLGPYFHSMGMSIEDKTYSLTIHYRNSSDAEVAEKIAFELLSKLPGAKITGGKCVLNVLPDDSINKGQALNRLMRDNGYDFGFLSEMTLPMKMFFLTATLVF